MEIYFVNEIFPNYRFKLWGKSLSGFLDVVKLEDISH